MTDAKDPLEELRSIEQDMNERAETGNSDMDDYRHWAGVRDGLAAWEKERAESNTQRADARLIVGQLRTLRAAVTSVLSEIRAVEYPDDQITPAFRECFDYVADALDAALGGGA